MIFRRTVWRVGNKTTGMQMNRMKLKIAALAAMTVALFIGAGCTSTTVTAMPGAWNPKPMAPGSYTVLNGGMPVTGQVTVELTGDKPMTSSLMRQVVDRALAQCEGADALIDTTQDSQMVMKTTMFGPFYQSMKMTYTVFLTGIPVKTKDSSQVKPVRAQE